MSELTDYFVHSYSLIIRNTPGGYYPARDAARAAVSNSGVSLSEYLAMTSEERNSRFAQEVGDAVIDLVNEWVRGLIGDGQGSIGAQLIDQVMELNTGTYVAYALGKDFMPESNEADEFLIDDESDDESNDESDD